MRQGIVLAGAFSLALLAFLGARAIDGVEAVARGVYRRAWRGHSADGREFRGWLEVRKAPTRGAYAGIALRVDAALAPLIARVLAACKHAFDLDCRPEEVATALGPLAHARPGLRLPGAFDGLELGVRAILGQQITVAAARTLARRVVQTFGEPISTPFAAVTRLFPSAVTLADATPAALGELGIVSQRARAIVALARRVADGLRLEPGADLDTTLDELRAIAGIGDWTAHYIAMRALHWPDAFPPGDVAVLKAMNETRPAAANARAELWRPWRAYAVMHLWQSLEKTR